jgi:hypothetical protein
MDKHFVLRVLFGMVTMQIGVRQEFYPCSIKASTDYGVWNRPRMESYSIHIKYRSKLYSIILILISGILSIFHNGIDLVWTGVLAIKIRIFQGRYCT